MSRKSVKLIELARVKYAIPHHAKPIKPVVDSFLYALAASGLTYRFNRVQKGHNSWYVDVTNSLGTKRFHLRFRRNPWRVDINRGYRRPVTVASMRDDRDVYRAVSQMVLGAL